ncbi:MAG TPA: AraC family transcriptional regulator [Caulobacteraceae bacterium]|jgi:AraC-like DNA-binding protein
MRHGSSERLPRHPHETAFAAIVLTGGYVEAGDTGRHGLTPGDVLMHRAWESHLDRFGRGGAEVLILPIQERDIGAQTGRVADPDALARLAEGDPVAASRHLFLAFEAKTASPDDWPDLLASALCSDPDLSLGHWADGQGLHLGSLSRGFRQVFAVTPSAYRVIQRTRRAVNAVRRSDAPLHRIAQDCGFADQAHMSRAIRGMTRSTPSALRKLS